jgi:hypothetical protein
MEPFHHLPEDVGLAAAADAALGHVTQVPSVGAEETPAHGRSKA